jgi:hypothetical protein
MVSPVGRTRETQARSGAMARMTCGFDIFATADLVLCVMVQVNR